MKKILAQSLVSVTSVVLMAVTPAYAELTINSSTGKTAPSSIKTLSHAQQVPSEASLIKLLEVTRMVDMMQSMSSTQSEMMSPIIESALKQKDLAQMTDQQRQEVSRVLTQYSQQLLADTNQVLLDVAQKQFVGVAKKHYTQAEVDAQIAFYSTEVGQSILDKQPKLMQEYMKVLVPEVMQVTNATSEKLMPKLIKDLDAILK